MREPEARALRIFRPGAPIFYGFVVYNARASTRTNGPEVEIRARVFRDGKPVWSGAPFSIADAKPEDPLRIRAGQQFAFRAGTPARRLLARGDRHR